MAKRGDLGASILLLSGARTAERYSIPRSQVVLRSLCRQKKKLPRWGKSGGHWRRLFDAPSRHRQGHRDTQQSSPLHPDRTDQTQVAVGRDGLGRASLGVPSHPTRGAAAS